MYSYIFFLLIITIGMAASYATGKLTLPAALSGGALSALMYFSTGWAPIVMMTFFFVSGTLATSWKHRLKESLHIAEKNKGRRNALQVLANAGTAGILSLISLIYPHHSSLFMVMIASSFSSATADTISSEMGSVYGRKFYNIITWKRDKRGLDGVISLEGCVWGFAGSIVIALVYVAFFEWDDNFLIIIIAGTLGNLLDSVLGATLERKKILTNDAVNFLNTMFAALAAAVFV